MIITISLPIYLGYFDRIGMVYTATTKRAHGSLYSTTTPSAEPSANLSTQKLQLTSIAIDSHRQFVIFHTRMDGDSALNIRLPSQSELDFVCATNEVDRAGVTVSSNPDSSSRTGASSGPARNAAPSAACHLHHHHHANDEASHSDCKHRWNIIRLADSTYLAAHWSGVDNARAVPCGLWTSRDAAITALNASLQLHSSSIGHPSHDRRRSAPAIMALNLIPSSEEHSTRYPLQQSDKPGHRSGRSLLSKFVFGKAR